MKTIQWPLLIIAILAAASLISVGVTLGENSMTGVILSFVSFVLSMGLGFVTKKKLREGK